MTLTRTFMSPARLLIPLLLLFSGCLGPVSELYPEEEAQRTVPVWLVSQGWHVGMAFEAHHLRDALPEHGELPETDYLMVGWGDDKYFPADRVRVDYLLRAAFWPTGSVMHVVGFDREADRYFTSRIVRVQLSEEGMEAMIDHITAQFTRDGDNGIIYAAPGLYRRSSFFKAEGWYFFPRTSNWWTARTLRKSGFPITPFWAFTSGNVMRQAAKEGEVVQE